MPIGGDTNLDETKVVIVARLIVGFQVKFKHVIEDEMHVRSTKPATSFPFHYPMSELCRLAKICILSGVDNEVVASRKQNIDKN